MKPHKKKQSKSNETPVGIQLPFGKVLHPLAALLPEMTALEFADLAGDIQTNGVRDPIVLTHDGKIVVDGRHRLLACDKAKVKPKWTRLRKSADDVYIAHFICSKNINRRQLTQSQRATIAVELLPKLKAEAKARQRTHGGTAPGKSKDTSRTSTISATAAEQAGKAVGVSASYVETAAKLKEEEPEKFEAVKKGKLSLSKARKSSKPAKAKAKKSEKEILADVQADVDAQYRAKGLPVPGESDDEPDETKGTRFQTIAPTQRVRSWLSAAKRIVSETSVLVGVELSDEEQEVVDAGVAEVRDALDNLAEHCATAVDE